VLPHRRMFPRRRALADQACSVEGAVLHVTFTGGESEYSIGPDVPILANAPGDMSLLKPGAAVFVIALKKPDGTVTAARLYAEKDGIKPPM
jgi:hypothetical protein